jgi:hypothetical protein
MHYARIETQESFSLDFDNISSILFDIDPKSRNISINNFAVLKDQILLNQYNTLYNSRIQEACQTSHPLNTPMNDKALLNLTKIPLARILKKKKKWF